MLISLCQNIKKADISRLPLFVVLEVLVSSLPGKRSQSYYEISLLNYYKLMSALFADYLEMERTRHVKFTPLFDTREMMGDLVGNFIRYESKEKRNSILEDKTLIGLLMLI